MSKAQRDKGATFEREIVSRFQEYGFDAERNLSQSRDGGYDIDSTAGAWECKKRAVIADYLIPVEGVRGVIYARDRGPRLAMIRLDDLLKLLTIERGAHAAINLVPGDERPARENP